MIADEAAIGMVNSKTTAVRIIPAIGKEVGEAGGLLGSGPVMPIRQTKNDVMINRGGASLAPLQSLKTKCKRFSENVFKTFQLFVAKKDFVCIIMSIKTKKRSRWFSLQRANGWLKFAGRNPERVLSRIESVRQ